MGRWSDGSADVELTVSLLNEGDLAAGESQLFGISCLKGSSEIYGCGHEEMVSLPGGFGPVTIASTLRVPQSIESLMFSYGDARVHSQAFSVPSRILGVDRDVWACFSDTSNVDTVWQEEEGIGCAGWNEEIIYKWDQTSSLRVKVNGPENFANEFRDVLNQLSPLVNLQFEFVENRADADIVAYIGLTAFEVELEEVFCPGSEVFGCANTIFESPSGKVLSGEIVVYNLWPDFGTDFGDFGEERRSNFRSAMYHEAIHALTRMSHRTELLSIMNRSVHERVELSPMDEALLRLHGNELVRQGMSLEDVEELIVFNDELMDPQPDDPRFSAWQIVSKAHKQLRESTTARYSVRSSFPGCSQQYGWAEYSVGNLTGQFPYFGWISIDDGDDPVYILQPYSSQAEHWFRSQSGWSEGDLIGTPDFLRGWHGDLSDPHHVLQSIIYYADWSEAEMTFDNQGRTVIRVELDQVRGHIGASTDSVSITLTIDSDAYTLVEYELEWDLRGETCDTYLLEAKDGQLGIEFEFPAQIQSGSAIIESCEAEPLGLLEGFLRRTERWARECVPESGVDGYAYSYRFTLEDWAFVRLELASTDNAYFNLLRAGDSTGESLNFEASAHLNGGHGVPEGSQLYWAHTPLSAGEYILEVITINRDLSGDFTMTVSAQPTPPPPYRFMSVAATGERTCGLLMDGTPLCWGRRGVEGNGSEAPEGRFASISGGGHSCALRQDGTPVCWDFVEEGEHSCGPRNGATYCRLNDQPELDGGSRDLYGGRVAIRQVGVIGGYYDQTPPPGEKLSSISTGWVHSCGLREDGTPVCWGSNQYGKATPPSDERFASIDAGSSHSCGVLLDGQAVCWGDDVHGQASPPTDERFSRVVAGENHSCGLREDSSITCWGKGGLSVKRPQPGGYFHGSSISSARNIPPSPPESQLFESLGTGSPNCGVSMEGSPICWTPYKTGLVSTPGGEVFTAISSSDRHACGLSNDGTAVCWGWNRFGESSPPSGVSSAGQQAPVSPMGLVSVDSGGYLTCALDSDGYTYCWGPNWWKGRFSGQFIGITSGTTHACGIRPNGNVVCHGANAEGESSPPSNGRFTEITSGFAHTCGLGADGSVTCWGRNDAEQSSPPSGEVFTTISSKGEHTCGLRNDGSIACWGVNRSGQTTAPSERDFESVSVGGHHTCALRTNGVPACWGLGREGQTTPPAGETFLALSSGGWHTCGLRTDGTVVCWGSNDLEQSSPPGNQTFIAISSGHFHTCGIRFDGIPVCWGSNDFYQALPST